MCLYVVFKVVLLGTIVCFQKTGPITQAECVQTKSYNKQGTSKTSALNEKESLMFGQIVVPVF